MRSYKRGPPETIVPMGTDGSSLEATLGDWSQSSSNGISSGGGGPAGFGTLITNADQGILYSWGLSAGGSTQNQLTTIAADGSASTVVTSMGSQVGVPVQPVLQRQDGTFVGTIAGEIMVAFTQAGQQLWSQPGFTPQIATSDGGVIAHAQSGQAVTFDQNGNQTGQLASLPTQSWTGNGYQIGSVDQVVFTPIDLALSFWSSIGGNPSVVNPVAVRLRHARVFIPYGLYRLPTCCFSAPVTDPRDSQISIGGPQGCPALESRDGYPRASYPQRHIWRLPSICYNDRHGQDPENR
jgi:hypothetical protein